MSYPDQYRYSKQHQWVHVEGLHVEHLIATVGLTKHGQQLLGDIVAVDLPKPGTIVSQAQEIGSFDSVTAVTELLSPVSGQVVEVNHLLEDKPEKLNKDPHGAAWLIRIRLSNPNEVTDLLTAQAYQAYVR